MNELSHYKINKLNELKFSYRITKDGKVFIYWQDKQVKTLIGKQASKLLSQISKADDKEKQLLLAKVTGNFKRGNEN